MNESSREVDETNISLLSGSIFQSTSLVDDNLTVLNDSLNFYPFLNNQSSTESQYPETDSNKTFLLDQATGCSKVPKEFNFNDTDQTANQVNQSQPQLNLNTVIPNESLRPKLNENALNYYHQYNHWNHFYYHNPWLYCPQFCQTHRMQFYPYYAYLRCFGPGHFQNQPNYVNYGENLVYQAGCKKRKKEGINASNQDPKDNFVDNIMLNTEKTPTSVETLETQERVADSHIPYIAEFELEVDSLNKTQDSELFKSKLQKKRRGRRSKKEMI